MKTKKCVLLAAGMGTRLRPLTDDRPKPMVMVGGVPLLEYNVRRLASYGIVEIGINLHYRPEVVRAHFDDGGEYGVSITYSFEPTLLGTAGAVKALEPFVNGCRVLVHYGDNLSTCDLEAFESLHEERGACATVALFEKDDVTPHSVVELEPSGRISRFVEKPKAGESPSHWISAGLILLEPRAIDYIPVAERYDFGYDFFPRLIAAGESFFGYRMGASEGLWWIDTPEDHARVSTLAASGVFG